MMASPKEKPGSKAVIGTDLDKDADIRQPSVNGEPRTLDQMTMERAMAAALKIYAEDPSEDFTKDAIDTATRENAPAKDAADANSSGRHFVALLQKAGSVIDTTFSQSKALVPIETPAGPSSTPST